ncbi:NAD-dependent epimerase/dehydratase family protein [Actinomycetospora cinnamomea]|uniref:Nucleoside-diphosphate-sugar epimerase n=1 Tax=Actinomycetospora cinnamomea TaxID=663609 RepID=A0A2U1FRK6_9PSEU|nr:NAD-dependent epimerase/dehydratase family protein [Actinomycetospora cinnamomea]PVZ14805.1 nucleoside-diphosphate-sugar epimerase [Actinomycetospora cinnamomea]
MRIAVTGATGNVGTALLRRLAREDHEVVGLARRVPGGTVDGAPVTWRSVDLTRVTGHELAEVFAGADAVVHLAWGFQPSQDLAYLRELGVGGTRRVVGAVAAAGVPHLVHMSSLGAYSPRRDDTPADEAYPTDGVPTSRYSRHKVAAERLLDEAEAGSALGTVTRLRPGVVGQRAAGSALLRYGVPGFVPARALGWLPVLPLDRGLAISVVHADDVADAVVRVLDGRVGGAFNLAADPPLTAADIAEVLGARLVHVPSSVLRPVVDLAWRLRLQQVDTGWLDMAFALPLLDSGRARTELGWAPTQDAVAVFREVLAGMRATAEGPTPVLRRRTVAGTVRDAVRHGAVERRHRP